MFHVIFQKLRLIWIPFIKLLEVIIKLNLSNDLVGLGGQPVPAFKSAEAGQFK